MPFLITGFFLAVILLAYAAVKSALMQRKGVILLGVLSVIFLAAALALFYVWDARMRNASKLSGAGETRHSAPGKAGRN